MLRYLSQEKCVKCDEPRFNGEVNRFPHRYHKDAVDVSTNKCIAGEPETEHAEHLDIMCIGCGYEWVEDVADSEPTEKMITIPHAEYEKLLDYAFQEREKFHEDTYR